MLEKFLDQILCQGSDSAGNMILILLDPVVSVLEGLSLKWWFPHQQCVQDTSQTPNIHLIAVSLLAKNLWSNVVWGSTQSLLPLSIIIYSCSQSKVSKLEITMDNFVLMKIKNSKKYVPHKVPCFWFSDCLSSLVQLHQTPLSAKLQDNVDKIIILKIGVEFHQVRIGDSFV